MPLSPTQTKYAKSVFAAGTAVTCVGLASDTLIRAGTVINLRPAGILNLGSVSSSFRSVGLISTERSLLHSAQTAMRSNGFKGLVALTLVVGVVGVVCLKSKKSSQS